MSDGADHSEVTKGYLLEQYKKKREELGNKMRSRQGNLSEEAFLSLVSISAADSFKEMQKQHIDEKTGLIKKEEFVRHLRNALDFVKRHGGTVNVYTIDLDSFKEVNDSIGYNAGDKVLKNVAEILRNSIRVYDTAGRLGGDEFGVIQINIPDDKQDLIANRFAEIMGKKKDVFPDLDNITASIGSARFKQHDGNIEPLDFLERSEIAMTHAKNIQGTAIVHWSENMTRLEKTLKGR